jgi:hypothetical protein
VIKTVTKDSSIVFARRATVVAASDTSIPPFGARTPLYLGWTTAATNQRRLMAVE